MTISPTLPTLLLAALSITSAHAQQQQTKPPISTYGVDVATRTMSIPGMPAGGMGGMAGMPGMPAGMGGPQKELWLGLRSSHRASGPPEAQHMIPPGMDMGPALPLLAPPPAQPGRADYDEEKPPEKPKARMLIYWGCGDTIRPGQPKVADTEKMSMVEFGQALAGRSPPERWSAIRNMQYVWPNEREKKQVPAQREPARRPARARQRDARHQVRDRRPAGLHAAARDHGDGADQRADAAVVGDDFRGAGLLPAGDGLPAERQRDDHLDVERAAGHGLGPHELPAQRLRAPDDQREGGAARVAPRRAPSRRACSRVSRVAWSTASRTARS